MIIYHAYLLDKLPANHQIVYTLIALLFKLVSQLIIIIIIIKILTWPK